MSTKEISLSEPLSLNGARVLLVEDEFYIADDVRPVLECAGARTAGPCSTVRQAEAALDENTLDCAVSDLHLQGQSAASFAASPLRSPPDMEAASPPTASATCRGSKSHSIRRHWRRSLRS